MSFLSLSSVFENRHELEQAEGMIRENIEALVQALEAPV